jgi:autotransporter-associated beta strand protein
VSSFTAHNNFPDFQFRSITIQGNRAYTIDGNQLTLGPGGLQVQNAVDVQHTFSVPLVLNGLGESINVTLGATLTLGGVLSGNAPLNKEGSSTLVLTAANTGFAGTVNVDDGVLQATDPNALGDGTHQTLVSNHPAATLELTASASGGTEVIHLAGDGFTPDPMTPGRGALVARGTVTWNGIVELDLHCADNNPGTSINVPMSGTTLTLAAGLIGRFSSLIKQGSGQLVVPMEPALESFPEGDVAAGVLILQSNMTVSGELFVDAGAALELQGGITVDGGPLELLGSGPSGAGALVNHDGNNTWSGDLRLGPGAVIGVASGTLTVTGAINNYMPGGCNRQPVSGPGDLNKVGTGPLTLTGTNSNYTGVTTVSAGILNIRSGSALGRAAAGATVAAGATLQFQGNLTSAAPITINGTGAGGLGALNNLSGTNILTGNVTLNSDSLIFSAGDNLLLQGTINTNGHALTVDGPGNTGIGANPTFPFAGPGIITGAGSLVKNGTGRLTLGGTGVSDYTGLTTINAGVVFAAKSSALGAPTVGTVVQAGATLQAESVIDEPLTLNGNGVGGIGALVGLAGQWRGDITLASPTAIGATDPGGVGRSAPQDLGWMGGPVAIGCVDRWMRKRPPTRGATTENPGAQRAWPNFLQGGDWPMPKVRPIPNFSQLKKQK